MLLSTQTLELSKRFGDEGAIKIIHESGFDAYDYTFTDRGENDPVLKDDFRDYFKGLREFADKTGIVCNQAHARFPVAVYGESEWNKNRYDVVLRDIEAASVLGTKIIVVHPIHSRYPLEGAYERNIEFYGGLMPYCRKYGIKIALENMWRTDPKRGFIIADVCSGAENFAKLLDGLSGDCFTACLDLGHCGLIGEEAQDAIRILGNRIGALHVHDNDYLHDSHTLPYLGKMEWDNILAALAEVGYGGDFTYEADNFLVDIPSELMPCALKFMASVGRKMISDIKNHANMRRK